MIIKSKSRKQPTPCDRTVHYINNRASLKDQLYSYGTADTGVTAVEAITKIEHNAAYQTGRSNGNAFYHEILSLGKGEDIPYVESVLVDLCHEYLRLRAPQGLAFFCTHIDHDTYSITDSTLQHLAANGVPKETIASLVPLKYNEYDTKAAFLSALRQVSKLGNLDACKEQIVALAKGKAPHAHIVLCANKIERSKQITMSTGEFEQIKRKMEQYQRAKYPELTKSITALTDETKRRKDKRPNQKTKVAGKSQTKVERVRAVVEYVLHHAANEQSLHQLLTQADLHLYCRGKTWGVEASSGQRYRMKHLGLEASFRAMVVRMGQVREREVVLNTAKHTVQKNKRAEHSYDEQSLAL